jgi:hypothetical protein
MGWKRKGTSEKAWDPSREERKSPSPKGEDDSLAPTKTQNGSTTEEKKEKPNSESKSG